MKFYVGIMIFYIIFSSKSTFSNSLTTSLWRTSTSLFQHQAVIWKPNIYFRYSDIYDKKWIENYIVGPSCNKESCAIPSNTIVTLALALMPWYYINFPKKKQKRAENSVKTFIFRFLFKERAKIRFLRF